MRVSLCLLVVFASLLFPASVLAQNPAVAGPPSPGSPRVVGHATWDERYLYFAFEVIDSDLVGTNTKPMSDAASDDSIAVYFSTAKEKPAAPDTTAQGMVVSAAGGFTFLRGDNEKKSFVPRPLFSIKYGVTPQGTLNRSDDRDLSYTVTMAIPLDALGLDGKKLAPGSELFFNAVARSRDNGTTGLGNNTRSEADAINPATWTRLILLPNPPGDVARYAGAVLSPRVSEKPPVIDGVYRPEAWPAVSRFEFASPDIPRPVVVVQPSRLAGTDDDKIAPPIALSRLNRGLENRLFARYLLRYQGDLRKAVNNPYRGIFTPEGTMTLFHHPATGLGPWFSTDRVSWHRNQLSEMRRSGIEAALVEMACPDSDFGPLDEKSLVVLVSALREMAVENIPGPELALCLDLAVTRPGKLSSRDDLPVPNAPKPDMTTSEGRLAVYEGIRRWFQSVPPEFRVRVSLPPDENGRVVQAYPVFLTNGDGVANLTTEWLEPLRQKFASDFGTATGGTTLLFVGGEKMASVPGLAATVPLLSGGKSEGPLSVFVIQPGNGSPDRFLPRRAGETYREAMLTAGTAKPTWLVLDSWNDWTRGTAVAASRQYGLQYQEMTRLITVVSSDTPRGVRWLAHDGPRRLRPGSVVQMTVTFRNAGTTPLRGADGIALTYRWKRGTQIVAESPVRLPIEGSLLPTQTVRLPVGLLAARATAEGKLEPLSPGDYTLEIDLSEKKDGNTVFLSDSSEQTQPLRFPITVTDFPAAVEFASTTTPPILISGGTYPVLLRLRWLGDAALSAKDASLIYQILTEDGNSTVYTGTIPLNRDLPPGQWETVSGLLKIGGNGTIVPAACPETRRSPTDTAGGYRLRWLLSHRESTDAVPGEFVEQISVYPTNEDDAEITPVPASPVTWTANALVQTAVRLRNRGATVWKMSEFRVTYHWYYPDGLEMDWRSPISLPLPRDVKPGETVTVKLPVRAPDREGEFVLIYDLLRLPGDYLSTRPISRTGDLGILPVHVLGGRLRFVDLTRHFNTDAIATENNPKDGDLDGSGNTLPAESFPPDTYGIAAYFGDAKTPREKEPVYPSGHFSEYSPSARNIAFRFGPERDGTKNAVACSGQKIDTPEGKYVTLHLAALATGGQEVSLPLILRYKKGEAEKVVLRVNDWNRIPGPSEAMAVRTAYKRTPTADVPGFCGLRHLFLPIDVTRELKSVELPTEARVKIFALTLEK